jgi:hypothetical protein
MEYTKKSLKYYYLNEYHSDYPDFPLFNNKFSFNRANLICFPLDRLHYFYDIKTKIFKKHYQYPNEKHFYIWDPKVEKKDFCEIYNFPDDVNVTLDEYRAMADEDLHDNFFAKEKHQNAFIVSDLGIINGKTVRLTDKQIQERLIYSKELWFRKYLRSEKKRINNNRDEAFEHIFDFKGHKITLNDHDYHNYILSMLGFLMKDKFSKQSDKIEPFTIITSRGESLTLVGDDIIEFYVKIKDKFKFAQNLRSFELKKLAKHEDKFRLENIKPLEDALKKAIEEEKKQGKDKT